MQKKSERINRVITVVLSMFMLLTTIMQPLTLFAEESAEYPETALVVTVRAIQREHGQVFVGDWESQAMAEPGGYVTLSNVPDQGYEFSGYMVSTAPADDSVLVTDNILNDNFLYQTDENMIQVEDYDLLVSAVFVESASETSDVNIEETPGETTTEPVQEHTQEPSGDNIDTSDEEIIEDESPESGTNEELPEIVSAEDKPATGDSVEFETKEKIDKAIAMEKTSEETTEPSIFEGMTKEEITNYFEFLNEGNNDADFNRLSIRDWDVIFLTFGLTEKSTEEERDIVKKSLLGRIKIRDPYYMEDFDEAAYAGLDFSSGRLIIGTEDPSIFVDPSVIISSLNGLYLLQFTSTETTRKAYAFYLNKASLVEIDCKVIAVNDESYVIEPEQDVWEIMTGESNPFTEMEEASMETGSGYYDVAIIDTGANRYVDSAVSIIGDDIADDNGHGTRMAELIKEQNPEARILSIKAFGSDGVADLSAIYAAFQYVLTQSVRIINISASAISADSSILVDAINAATASGITVVASAGNNGSNAAWFVPAGLAGVTTIGACDEKGVRLASSNYGACVEYNVVAGSTSEAAAKFSGWLSANSMDAIQAALGNGFLFPSAYTPVEDISRTLLAAFREIMDNDPSIEDIQAFLSALSIEQAQGLYTELSWDEVEAVTNVFLNAYAHEYGWDTAIELAGEVLRSLFHLDVFIISTNAGENASVAGGTAMTIGHTFGDYVAYSDGVTYLTSMPYSVTTPSGTFQAYCAEATSDTPDGSVGPTIVRTNDVLTKIYLVSPLGPLYEQYRSQIFDGTLADVKANCFAASIPSNEKDYMLAHVMVSGTYANDYGSGMGPNGTIWTDAHLQAIKNAVAQIDTLVTNNNPYFRSAKSYVVQFSTGIHNIDVQDVFWVEWTELPPEPDKGIIRIQKSSGNTSVTSENGNYSLEGAVYEVYSGSDLVGTITTDSSGAGSLEVETGSYTVKELTASSGYDLDITSKNVTVTANNTSTVNSSEPPKTGSISLIKSSADASKTGGNSNYTLEGAVYGIYKDSGCTNLYTTMKTDANGRASVSGIPLGTYYIKETSAPAGFNLDATVKTVTVSVSSLSASTTSSEAPVTGTVGFSKVSAIPQATYGNPMYSLENAVYGIYLDETCADLYTTAKTDANGKFSLEELPLGIYYVQEITPSKGFAKDETKHKVVLTAASASKSITSTEPVNGDPISVLAAKVDAETNTVVTQGAGVMKDAEFTVQYYTNETWSGDPERTWVFKTNSDGKARLDTSSLISGTMYTTPNGVPFIPSGSFTIQETVAPDGFNINNDVFYYKVNGDTITYTGDAQGLNPIGTNPRLVVDQGVTIKEVPVRGGIQLTKLVKDTNDNLDGNASVAGIRFAIVLSSGKGQNDVYVPAGGTKYTEGQVVKVITTNAEGVAQTGIQDLPYGYYDVYELSRDSNILAGDMWTAQEPVTAGKLANGSGILYNALHTQLFVDTESTYKTWNIANDIVYGFVKVTKNDADRKTNQEQGDASLAGIRYAVVNRSAYKVFYPAGTHGAGKTYPVGTVVDILTTDSKGNVTSNKLPYGTYDIIELRADATIKPGDAWKETGSSIYANDKGYLYKAKTNRVTVDTYNQTYDVSYTNQVVRGGVKIQKILEELQAAQNEGLSRMEGVTFSVVNASNTQVYVNNQWYDTIADKGTNGSDTEGSASISDIGYSRSQLISEVADKNVIVATMTTDAAGKCRIEGDVLPYGTYYIYEETANRSMHIDDDWVLRIEVREEGVVIDAESMPAQDPIVRGDLNFRKVNIDGIFRPNIPFLIISYAEDGTALESHVIVTDTSGTINTATRDNTNHTNEMDQYVTYNEATGEYIINAIGEALLADGTAATFGIWFSQGRDPVTGERTSAAATPTDGRGALYYGNYRIFEIKCKDNTKKSEDLLKSPVFMVGAMPTEKTTYQDAYGHVTSETSDKVLNYYRHFVDLEVDLKTVAQDETTKTKVTFVYDDNVLSDQVSYTHLKSSTVYKWVVDFVQADNVTNILSEVVVDGYVPIDSSPNVETAQGTFTVSTDGSISGDFNASTPPTVTSTGNVDTTNLEGGKVAAVVYLYEYINGYDFGSAVEVQACDFITSHNTDAKDADELIYVPSMETTATDSMTGDHVGTKHKDDKIREVVSMTQLGPKEKYMLIETIMDKDTGTVFAQAEKSLKTFYSDRVTPVVPYVTQVMPDIAINSSAFSAKTLVVYEELWLVDEENEKLHSRPVVTHEVLLDEKESLHYIAIDTVATDTSTGDHVGKVTRQAGQTTTIEDRVELTNLIPLMKYRVHAKLVYKEDCTDANGKTHKAGEAIELQDGSVTDMLYTAWSDTGHVTATYVVDSSMLENISLVSTEYVYHNGVLIDSHVDLEDEDQTVHFPKIRTNLTDDVDDDDEDLFADPDHEMHVTDTVTYENLVPGMVYVLNGKLYVQETGEAAKDESGKEIVGSTVFTAPAASGSIEVTFSFHGRNLAGYSLVAYEKLFHNNVEVTRHEDLEDEAQTLHLPKITTDFVDDVDKDPENRDALAAEEMTLVDTVTYENLVVGRKYTIKGILMDKETGLAAIDDEGNKIEGSTTFTAKSIDGTVEVLFTFSGLGQAGKSLVAFESLYRGSKKLEVHEDIDDDAQTIDVPRITTELVDSVDGDTDALASEEMVLIDKVTYENLLVGREYTVNGKLYDQMTGKPAKDDDGNEITATASFTARTKSGNVKLEFAFPGVSLAGHTVVAFEQLIRGTKSVALHEDIKDAAQSVYIPEILTTLKDTIDGEHDAFAGEVTLIDTVEYKNLIVGYEYTVNGVLVEKSSQEALKHEDGTSVAATATFTAETKNGSIDLEFSFDASELAGKDVVAFENLYRTANIRGKDDKLVAIHEDIEDESQTVHIPKILTSLKDPIDNDIDALASEKVLLVDTVSYENLIPGKEYTVYGILMDKETEETALDDNGKEIKAETTFTAESKNGTVGVSFAFSGVILEGRDVVAFEELYTATKIVAEHKDINDKAQKVDIPKIRTTLEDTVDEYIDSLAAQNMALVDIVTYENLIPGREYVLYGILMDKATGEAALDDNGEVIEAETAFTAQDEDGAARVTFRFSGECLAGHTVVAFERLYRNDKLVGIHCDLDDFDQMNWIPRIETSLKDTVDMDDDAEAAAKIKLVDRVSYYNLLPGRDYRVDGTLMDQTTGQAVLDDEGNEITGSASFTAEESDGAIEVLFKFSGETLAGHTVVAFEDLFRVESVHTEEGVYNTQKNVAIHHEITDESQSVHIPKIETTLGDESDAEHDALAEDAMVLVDVVPYENLIIGREYTVKGILMDKETSEPALDDVGNTITAEKTFTAEETDGTVSITFSFKGVTMKGKTVVAFEDLYRGKKHLAAHADIDDEDQSVYIPEITTDLKDSIDGWDDALAASNVVLVDTVTYKNLIPGRTYTVEGMLYDQGTSKPALDDNGKEITAKSTFTAKEAEGSEKITFAFSGVTLAGCSVVAFETMYRNGKIVAEHKDINDNAQTVTIPKILTDLKDAANEGHTAEAASKVELVDEVTYQNLTPGEEYVVSGILMDKATKSEAQDDNGKQIVAEATFTPETANGSVQLMFSFPGASLAGKSVVAFETMTRAGKKVAEHKDIEDEDQTVHLPKIATVLLSKQGLHNAYANGKVNLVDTVIYENLVPGEQYVVKGILMDKETGKAVRNVNNKEVSAIALFEAKESNGSVEMTFNLDNIPKEGLTAVAFETLYCTKDGKENGIIARHQDLSDKDQTAGMPSLKTEAVFGSGEKKADTSKEQVVKDHVAYSHLEPGTYILRTALMKKSDGKPVSCQNTPVTAQMKVELNETSGSITAEMKVPAGAIVGDAVVFEELYQLKEDGSEVLVGTHKDLEDEAQTVTFLQAEAPAPVKTGDETNTILWHLMMLAAICSSVLLSVIVYKRMKQEN